MTTGAKPLQPVLLVEDNPDVQEALVILFERAGYAVSCAGDGREALAKLRNGLRPCLILLDYRMPIMDGRTFRIAQLAEGLQLGVPVVFLSGDARVPSDDLQVNAVLKKPIDFDDLLKVVDSWVCPDAPIPARAA